MGELRFGLSTRRKGEPSGITLGFRTEDYATTEELKDAINHHIDVWLEEEEEYSYRNEGDDA